ncbi:hypothetical protein F442_09608 [Phytophthora nicotianae P10297]|uniref:Uncharacterized protein n=1 Tax=Phytophthora nicotianae P10297 TaxID=1317064 RepID=W2Z9T1_PHYNI|nr:hypothetical protein F442_09608 [Phytophthora nicotianae P10297]
MERVPSLPLPLFSSIVSFAVQDYTDQVLPETRRIHLAFNRLKDLSLVSKTWYSSVRELVYQFQRSTFTLKFQTASRHELLAMRRKVLERGRYVTDLRVSMGDVSSFGEYFRRGHRLPANLDTLELGWDALIAPMPGLRRLDLSEMPLSSPHTQKVVEAATKYCRELEALVLPGKEHHSMHPGAEVDELLSAVYKGLENWRPTGHRTGLRQLKVPTINEEDRFQSSREFINHVVKYCPNVEYLDGYKQSLCEMDRMTCQDMWMLNLDDWTKFNATCTNIREFNWVVAPFADPFFKVFGEHVKPKLSKLVFAVNMLWDWGRYFHELDKEAGTMARTNIVHVSREGYGWYARDPSTALLGCPGLEELEIALYHPLADDDEDEPSVRDPQYFPDEEVIEKSSFNDHFWETLVANCPLINRIALWEVVEGLELAHIHSFTDRGLVALSQLKYLDFMELRPINCTGNGLFDFLNGFSDEFSGQRTFQICVGGKSIMPEFERTDMDFYDAVMSLLTRIASTPANELHFSQQRIVLRLKNAITNPVEKEWSATYLDSLKKLVARVKEAHLSLHIRVTMHAYNRKSFKSILELGLYAAHAEPSYWFGWDDEESNRDVVFVNRGGRIYPDDDTDTPVRENVDASDSEFDEDSDDDISDVDLVL